MKSQLSEFYESEFIHFEIKMEWAMIINYLLNLKI